MDETLNSLKYHLQSIETNILFLQRARTALEEEFDLDVRTAFTGADSSYQTPLEKVAGYADDLVWSRRVIRHIEAEHDKRCQRASEVRMRREDYAASVSLSN